MVVFMFLSYSNLFGGETERDITKISVIGIKRENSQVEDFKRGIEEAANAKRVDVEYLEIEDGISQLGKGSAVRKEENPADLGESGRNRRKNDPCLV